MNLFLVHAPQHAKALSHDKTVFAAIHAQKKYRAERTQELVAISGNSREMQSFDRLSASRSLSVDFRIVRVLEIAQTNRYHIERNLNVYSRKLKDGWFKGRGTTNNDGVI